MKVLVLGGSGFIGNRLAYLMLARGDATPIVASRRAGGQGFSLDTRDEASLVRALREVDAVVNCVAGSASAIAQGARVLARAARQAGVAQVVHMSSMVVYGEQEGLLDEAAPLRPARGWYARAKRSAEEAMGDLAAQGARVTVLRPGCVWGPGSALWVDRIAAWLASARLGDLGEAGDGWTNGVTRDDVCEAALRALHQPAPAGTLRVFNLAAPDSPRWNDWFTDLAVATGATPLRRVHPLPLWLDAWVTGAPLHAARRLLACLGLEHALPGPISPGLLRLWRRQLRMDASAATRALGLSWTPYRMALQRSAAHWLALTQPSGGAA